MSLTFNFGRSVQIGGDTLSKSIAVTAGQEVRIDEAIADNTTDALVALALDVSQIQGMYIEADQDLTLETNNGSTPDDTINLVANKPLEWVNDGYMTNPLTTDVTALYVTNGSGSSTTLKAIFAVDPTV